MGRSHLSTALEGCVGCQVLDTVGDVTFIVDAAGRVVFWNQAAAAFYGIPASSAVGRIAQEFLAVDPDNPERDAEAAKQLATGQAWHVEAPQFAADGRRIQAHVTVTPIVDRSGGQLFATTVRDVTDHRELERQRDLLAMAVEQSAESVVITDLDANILYVNPAFSEASGYGLEEVIGKNPRILKSGRQPPAFYTEMWQRLVAGETFRAEFENRRKDGTMYREVASISPVRGASGAIERYVAVKRDVTRQRTFEQRIAREARHRAAAIDAIATMRPGVNAEATALRITDALVHRCGFSSATILSFEADDQAIMLASAGKPSSEPNPRVVSTAISTELTRRSRSGPWIEQAGRHATDRRRFGIGATAHAPILFGAEAVGLLAVGVPIGMEADLTARLDFVVELAAMSAGLLGPALEARRATAATRQRIEAVLTARAYHPVFQPLVDLASGTIVGQEALTRFEDRTPPDVVFATAARCGIGLELEEATLAAALDAGGSLPANGPLHVNVSPALILEEGRLTRLLSQWGWNVTLEVTEHEPIEDYDAIRAALARIGRGLELAVDDAGAGFASLRHILELRPHVVKLDRVLVSGIDADPTRQALVAGMVHFAASTGFTILAEGIETEAERATLLELGVTRGQGWLFGRAVAAPAAEAAPRRSATPDVRPERPGRVRPSVAALAG